MTDAIEAGARAIFAAREWPLAIHPAFEHEQEDWMACAKACIEAAIASGALVPASAVAEMRERCAKVIQSECDRILSKQTPTADPFSDAYAINSNLRMMAVTLPDLVDKVRQLDLSPSCGDYVVVHKTDLIELTRICNSGEHDANYTARRLSSGEAQRRNEVTAATFKMLREKVAAMIHAATGTGGGK